MLNDPKKILFAEKLYNLECAAKLINLTVRLETQGIKLLERLTAERDKQARLLDQEKSRG